MARTKAAVKETAEERTYNKDQILKAKKYRHRRDILNVLLKENQQYTLESVDQVLNEFYKKKVN